MPSNDYQVHTPIQRPARLRAVGRDRMIFGVTARG